MNSPFQTATPTSTSASSEVEGVNAVIVGALGLDPKYLAKPVTFDGEAAQWPEFKFNFVKWMMVWHGLENVPAHTRELHKLQRILYALASSLFRKNLLLIQGVKEQNVFKG